MLSADLVPEMVSVGKTNPIVRDIVRLLAALGLTRDPYDRPKEIRIRSKGVEYAIGSPETKTLAGAVSLAERTIATITSGERQEFGHFFRTLECGLTAEVVSDFASAIPFFQALCCSLSRRHSLEVFERLTELGAELERIITKYDRAGRQRLSGDDQGVISEWIAWLTSKDAFGLDSLEALAISGVVRPLQSVGAF